jgi:hypothetical protein
VLEISDSMRVKEAKGMATNEGADAAAMERSLTVLEPIDPTTAGRQLREVREIMARMGVTFFLRQGTCLGAIREGGLIPWDDDMDIGSVIGLHGLTEGHIDPVVAAFKDKGYFAREIIRNDHSVVVSFVKSSIRLDWACYRIIEDSIFHYPGVQIPVRLLTQLKEIDFVGEKFLVPNPPEEYLEYKYGPEWRTPKGSGSYEDDIVRLITREPMPGRAGKLRQFLTRQIPRWRVARLRVLNSKGETVSKAEVVIVGLNRSRTNGQGYARFYLPLLDYYPIMIRYDGHEELLYMEEMGPGRTYVYRADPSVTSGRNAVLPVE